MSGELGIKHLLRIILISDILEIILFCIKTKYIAMVNIIKERKMNAVALVIKCVSFWYMATPVHPMYINWCINN